MGACSANKCVGNNRSISYFSFPKHHDQKLIWIQYCDRVNFVPLSHHKLCSRHFSALQMTHDPAMLRYLGCNFNYRVRLRDNAVPDIPLEQSRGHRRRNRNAPICPKCTPEARAYVLGTGKVMEVNNVVGKNQNIRIVPVTTVKTEKTIVRINTNADIPVNKLINICDLAKNVQGGNLYKPPFSDNGLPPGMTLDDIPCISEVKD